MELLLDIVHAFQAAMRGLRDTAVANPLEIATGVAALLLILLRVYRLGRKTFIDKIRPYFVSEERLWDRRTRRNLGTHARQLRDGPPVLTIENFKGGVGKSTLTANLAAFYDWLGLRVLLIDFDYQGSLTDSIIKTDDELKLGAIDLLKSERTVSEILKRRERPISNFQNTDVLASAYTLNQVENKVAFKWLVGESGADVRYNVHGVLSSKAFRSEGYDIIIIDAPPRLTTASANALCASTHVLVPTILDGVSATAAVSTIDAVLKLRDRVSPTLNVVGIVPTFVFQSTGYRRSEIEALSYIRGEIVSQLSSRQTSEIRIFEDQRIVRKVAFADAAGERVAFFEDNEVRAMFTELGEAIALAIGGEFAGKVQNGRPRSTAAAREPRSNVVNVGR